MRTTVCLVLTSCLLLVLVAAHGDPETDKRLFPGKGGWGLKLAANPDPTLPRVLLIGDSVLNGYRGNVYKGLAGKANVDAWVNAYNLNSGPLLTDLKAVLAHGPYAVIHFNLGLHGYPKGRIPQGQYVPLMQKYVQALKDNAPHAILIWASTTPVTVKGDPEKLDPDINPIIVHRNVLAAQVMAANKIPIDDLYSLMLPHLALAHGDQFHWTPPGYAILGQSVTDIIIRALSGKLTAGK